jgi:predicted nucleic acid-binding protein
MTIYADTSFLVASLYAGHPQHVTARTFLLAHAADDWFTSQWSRFETLNTFRQLTRDPAGPKIAAVESLRRLFRHLHRRGPFVNFDSDLESAAQECQRISAAWAVKLKMRSADVLHVAILDELRPNLFVTRDKDQHQLANELGFVCQLLP